MINGPMLKAAIFSLNESMKKYGREINAEEIAGIIEGHAVTTALSAAASGVLPGVGSSIALGIACTSTVIMYGRLANAMGVTLSKGIIKALASAVGADLSAFIATSVLSAAAISFIPFFGNMSAAAITGVSNFAFIYIAGILFLKILSAFGIDRLENMSSDEIKNAAKSVQEDIDLKTAMKEAKQAYKAKK